jgi:thiol-disulfide isomerase/thioredoxin
VTKPFLRGLAVLIGIVSGAGSVSASPLAVGVQAPALDGQTLEGGPFNSRWSEGDATIVMFFATYCQPCHRALSELEAIQRTTGRRLRFVLVDAGEAPAIVRRFLAQNRTPAGAGVVLDASGNDRQRWGCCEIEPTLFIVDRVGRVRYINHGWGEGSEAKYLRRVQNVLRAPDAEAGGPG